MGQGQRPGVGHDEADRRTERRKEVKHMLSNEMKSLAVCKLSDLR